MLRIAAESASKKASLIKASLIVGFTLFAVLQNAFAFALDSSDLSGREISVSGFINVGVSNADKDYSLLQNVGIEDNLSFKANSVVGLQLDYDIAERTQASVQFIADDFEDGFDVRAEWFYISYLLADNVKARLGQLRVPIFLISESFYVGQSYDWSLPPIELHSMTGGLTRFNGVDFIYHKNIRDNNLTIQPYLGQSEESISLAGMSADFKTKSLRGISFEYDMENILFHYSHSRVIFDILPKDIPLSIEVKAKMHDIAMQYSRDSFGFITEYVYSDHGDLGTGRVGYGMLSYILGPWTPLLTYTKHKTTVGSSGKDIQGKSVSVGFRYDVNASFSVKGSVFKGDVLDSHGAQAVPFFPQNTESVRYYHLAFNVTF